MVIWRKLNTSLKNRIKITFRANVYYLLTRVIKRYPYINCSVEGEKIIFKKDINMGMAHCLPASNLIVPVN